MTPETILRINSEGEPQEIIPEILTGQVASEILRFFELDSVDYQVSLLSNIDGFFQAGSRLVPGRFLLLGIKGQGTKDFEVFWDIEPGTKGCRRHVVGLKGKSEFIQPDAKLESQSSLLAVEIDVDPRRWIDQPLVKTIFTEGRFPSSERAGFEKVYLVRLHSKEDIGSPTLQIADAEEGDCAAYSLRSGEKGIILVPGRGLYQDGVLVLPLSLILSESPRKKQLQKMLGLSS